MRRRSLRVLHCPFSISGYPYVLCRAERSLGLRSQAVSFVENKIRYPMDRILWSPGDRWLRREARRWRLLVDALLDFDIVHFNFGSSILNFGLEPPGPETPWKARLVHLYERLLHLRDLPVLRSAGTKICVTYQGDDARQADVSLARQAISVAQEAGPVYREPWRDERKRRDIALVSRHAHRIFALTPDLLGFLPERATYMPMAIIDLALWSPVPSRQTGRPLVLHAPTDRLGKGTRFILAAVERLRAEGVEFDFELVEGLDHATARRLYERADLLVDQLLAGWFGSLGVELMALGKPVICYLRPEDVARTDPEFRAELPVISATPSTIHDVLKEWLTTRRHLLPELGRKSRAFVERWFDAQKIAARLATEYAAIAAGD